MRMLGHPHPHPNLSPEGEEANVSRGLPLGTKSKEEANESTSISKKSLP